MKPISLILCAVLVSTMPLAAQELEGPQGIAVAQAPEAGLGVCHGLEAAQTMACAQAQCIAVSGLTAEDCVVHLWSTPAHWSADLFVQHNEGPHWHEVVTGWSSREKLEEAIALKCAEDYLMECTTVRIWDPQGEQVLKADQSVAASGRVEAPPVF